MKSILRPLVLAGTLFGITTSAMAAVVGAPGPEIGDGVVGAVVAAVALSAFVLYPRLKGMLQSREH